MSETRPFRCFNVRIVIEALIASAVIVALGFWGRTLAAGSAPRILVAAGQVAAFARLLFELIASVRRLDELERRIHTQALAFSAAAIVLVIGGWEFFEKAGLPSVRWSGYALPLLSISWALAVTWISRRYR